MPNKLFIHIGLPKTASSFLQQQVFPFFDQVGYIGMPFVELNHAFNHLKYSDDSRLDLNAVAKAMTPIRFGKKILSDEILSGFISISCVNRTTVARRMAQVFPDATIILFLRGQRDILYSAYKQWVLGCNGVDNIQQYVWKQSQDYTYADYFLNKKVESLNHFRPYYNMYTPSVHLDNVLYFELVGLYKSLFQDVEIFLFEDFKKNPAGIVERLEALFEASLKKDYTLDLKKKVNPGMNDEELLRRRFKNKALLFRELKFLSRNSDVLYRRFANKESKEKDYLKGITEGYYVENNRMLIKNFPEIGIQNYPEAYMQ